MPVLSDKLRARDVVAARVGPGVLTELLGVWDQPRRNPLDHLTVPYVLKVTSGSGWNVFCPDPAAVDRAAVVATLQGWRRRDYADLYREWCYRPLVPRIIAERLMVDPAHPGRSPDDLKVHCLNGRPRFVQVCVDRRYECFDPGWNVIELRPNGTHRCDAPPPPPDGLDGVFAVAAELSAGFPYVRVDLNRHLERTVSGEMTRFPFSGLVPMADPATDGRLGSWLTLPDSEPLPAAIRRPRPMGTRSAA